MIDGRLADPQYQLPSGVADGLHDQLFELELSLHNIGQLVERLTASEPPMELPAGARDWLVELRDGHTTSAAQAVHDLCRRRADPTVSALDEQTTIRLYALAAAIVHAGEALEGWARLPLEPASWIARLPALDVDQSYESPVMLRPDGRLRGSASSQPGNRGRRRRTRPTRPPAPRMGRPGRGPSRGRGRRGLRRRIGAVRAALLLGGDRGVHRLHGRQHRRRAALARASAHGRDVRGDPDRLAPGHRDRTQHLVAGGDHSRADGRPLLHPGQLLADGGRASRSWSRSSTCSSASSPTACSSCV